MGFFSDLGSGDFSGAWDDLSKSTGTNIAANPQQQTLGDSTGANLGQMIAQRGSLAAPQAMAAQAGPAAQVQAANAGQAAQLNTPQDSRSLQLSLANRLQNQAMGQGPSVAGLQFQQNQDANLAAAQAQVASARGVNPGLANRIIANQAGNMNQAAANQSAQLRMQEQMNANNQLAGVAGTLGQQDISQASQNAQLAQAQAQYQAGLQQQAALQNAQLAQQTGLQNAQFQQQANLQNPQLALQAQQVINSGQDSLLGLGNQRDLSQLGADQNFQQMLYNKAAANQAGNQKLFGGFVGGLGSALGLSSLGTASSAMK